MYLHHYSQTTLPVRSAAVNDSMCFDDLFFCFTITAKIITWTVSQGRKKQCTPISMCGWKLLDFPVSPLTDEQTDPWKTSFWSPLYRKTQSYDHWLIILSISFSLFTWYSLTNRGLPRGLPPPPIPSAVFAFKLTYVIDQRLSDYSALASLLASCALMENKLTEWGSGWKCVCACVTSTTVSKAVAWVGRKPERKHLQEWKWQPMAVLVSEAIVWSSS